MRSWLLNLAIMALSLVPQPMLLLLLLPPLHY